MFTLIVVLGMFSFEITQLLQFLTQGAHANLAQDLRAVDGVGLESHLVPATDKPYPDPSFAGQNKGALEVVLFPLARVCLNLKSLASGTESHLFPVFFGETSSTTPVHLLLSNRGHPVVWTLNACFPRLILHPFWGDPLCRPSRIMSLGRPSGPVFPTTPWVVSQSSAPPPAPHTQMRSNTSRARCAIGFLQGLAQASPPKVQMSTYPLRAETKHLFCSLCLLWSSASLAVVCLWCLSLKKDLPKISPL